MRWVRATVVMLIIGVPMASCGSGSDGGTSASPSPVATAPAPATPATALNGTPEAVCTSELKLPAAAAGDVTVNADGDGIADRFRAEPGAERGVTLQVVLDERAAFRLEMEQGGERIAAIGGYDVDGDGRDELFAVTGNGAYSTWIDVFVFDEASCALVRLAAPGGVVPQFAVGASVGNGSGLTCDNGKLVATTFTRTSDEPLQYGGTRTSYTISGMALAEVEAMPVTFEVAGAGQAARFNCGTLALR